MRLTRKDEEKWIAVVDEKVVAKGEDINSVYTRAKELCPGKEPILDVYMGKIAMVV